MAGQTKVYFTAGVDHRVAWIGNEANGNQDIIQELLTQINSASQSIDVSTMTFSVEQVAQALAAKAHQGVAVRIVGNAGHRHQAGYLVAQRGPVQLVDQYVPALVARVSFQSEQSPAPTGFVVDSGHVYGQRSVAAGQTMHYGWDEDVRARIKRHEAPPQATVPADFTSPLLGECFAIRNTETRRWTIKLASNEFYYVRAVCGQAAYRSKNAVLAQNETIFSLPDRDHPPASKFLHWRDAAAGGFVVSTVEGGDDTPSTPDWSQSRRVKTGADGKLVITVGLGSAGERSYSSLDYIEVYRGSSSEHGDRGNDWYRVQEYGLHHSKFFIFDRAAVWTGSHNITAVDPSDADVRSEDAILTRHQAVVDVFMAEFNRWWGAAAGAPIPSQARTLVFKPPETGTVLVPGLMSARMYPWRVRFSPSTRQPPSLDMYTVLADFVGRAQHDLILLLEQFRDSGEALELANNVVSRKMRGLRYAQGMHGTPADGTPASMTALGSKYVAKGGVVHNKVALVDAYSDDPVSQRGRLLCGSMNWSWTAMQRSNEQTLLIEDPAMANQYLQLALGMFQREGITIDRRIDCDILLDRSGSMTAQLPGTRVTRMQAAAAAAKAFLDMLSSDSHRVGLVPFGKDVDAAAATPVLDLHSRRADLVAAIDRVSATGPLANATCFGRPLAVSRSRLNALNDRAPRRVLVFLSDGMENTSPYARQVYPSLVTDGIAIHTTSFGEAATSSVAANEILAEMADASGASFQQVSTTTSGNALTKRFLNVARDAMRMTTIRDPTWSLEPGATAKDAFPVDAIRGRLVIAWVWTPGVSASAVKTSVSLPDGTLLGPLSPGVTVKTGDTHQIWHVDLASAAPAASSQGVWTSKAVAAAHVVVPRLDLCVFVDDDATCAHVRVEAHRVLQHGRKLIARVLDGFPDSLPHWTAKLMHTPPGDDVPREVPLVVDTSKPTSKQVSAEIPRIPGSHHLRLIVQGKARCRATGKQVAFAREKTLAWVESSEMQFLSSIPSSGARTSSLSFSARL